MEMNTGVLSTGSEFTIVSAFLSQVNSRGDRNIEKYVNLGKQLLCVRIPQIVFLERAVFDEFFGDIGSQLYSWGETRGGMFGYAGESYEYRVVGHVTFVFFEKRSMYLGKWREAITEFDVQTPYPQKDTLDYMFVQCHKTEWTAMAIALDGARGGFSAGVYVWLDFGVRHMFRSDIRFEVELYQLRDRALRPSVDGFRLYATGCWNPKGVYSADITRNIYWVFAGTVFGGKVGALLEFARRTKETCLSLIREKRRLMWEVNVWYLLYLACPSLFVLGHGDHNATILKGMF